MLSMLVTFSCCCYFFIQRTTGSWWQADDLRSESRQPDAHLVRLRLRWRFSHHRLPGWNLRNGPVMEGPHLRVIKNSKKTKLHSTSHIKKETTTTHNNFFLGVSINEYGKWEKQELILPFVTEQKKKTKQKNNHIYSYKFSVRCYTITSRKREKKKIKFSS